MTETYTIKQISECEVEIHNTMFAPPEHLLFKRVIYRFYDENCDFPWVPGLDIEVPDGAEFDLNEAQKRFVAQGYTYVSQYRSSFGYLFLGQICHANQTVYQFILSKPG